MRGTLADLSSAGSGRMGSSPRMRGTPNKLANITIKDGIIPAYAGNTRNTFSVKSVPRDHPRVCGEHRWWDAAHVGAAGSSPRMRGTPENLKACAYDCGIIPAYAGNTPSRSKESTWTRDHPRVCGEHMLAARSVTSPMGSSPRMRGTHRQLDVY